MEHFLKNLAQHWDLSPAQYWHLRLLCATLLGPLLGVLCLVLFSKQRRRSTSASPKPAGRIRGSRQQFS